MTAKHEDVKAERVRALMAVKGTTFIRFRGRTMVNSLGIEGADDIGGLEPTRGFVPLAGDWFSHFIYLKVGLGTSKTAILDYQHAIESIAPDWSCYDHLIGFGDGRVWDMRKLAFVEDQLRYVYETKYVPQSGGSLGYEKARQFLLQLSQGDADLAYDYAQAMAPLFMKTRPAGIIWFMGNGANGKSTLLDILYKVFPTVLASVNTAQLEDGKVLPVLSGMLGNIVQEASEARIEDAGNYKLLGTRQDLSVRKMFSQEMITISSDFHTIFNANNIPTFADKTTAIRRRTLIVPFLAHFADDPGFEARTLTADFIGGMITLCLEAAVDIHKRGDNYAWSVVTTDLKRQYDEAVNTAEAFAGYLREKHILGFYNWGVLYRSYELWCHTEGHPEMFKPTFKRTLTNEFSPIKRSALVDGKVRSCMFFDGAPKTLTWLNDGYGVAEPEPEAVQLELEEEAHREW